jgi:hypothetical protein
MKKQLLLIIIIALFILPLISAESSFTLQQNKAIDLKISCLDIDNSFCNNQTTCLITIYSPPNQTLLVDNQNMTWHSNYFNYSLNGSQLSTLGTYNVVTQCIGATTGFSTFNFDVTIMGNKVSTSGILESLFLIAFFAIIILLLFTMFSTISRVAFKEFYLLDVIISIGLYIGLVIYNFLANYYLQIEWLLNFTRILMQVGVWTHVMIPLVAFFIVLVLNWRTYNTEKDNLDNYAPMNTNLDWRHKRNDKNYEPRFYK